MPAPAVEFDRDLPARKGDFGASIEERGLHLPAVLKNIADSLQVRTAAQVVSAMEMVPSVFCEVLGWTEAELSAARSALVDQLHARYPDLRGLEDTDTTRPRCFGAIKPSRSGWGGLGR